MKKKLIILIVLVIVVVASAVLTACEGKYNKSVYDSLDNIAGGAKYYAQDGEKEIKSFKMTDSTGLSNSVTIDLGEKKTYNTIVLKESSYGVKKFHIYGSDTNGKDYNLIHVGDTIEGLRVCHLGDVSYRYLRIMIADHDGSYNLNSIGVYSKKVAKDTNFRVTGYVVTDQISAETDLSMLNGLTDIILFGVVKYTVNGELKFEVWDGNANKSIDVGIEGYKERLQYIRNALGGRDVNIVADIGMPYGQDGNIQKLMTDGRDKAIESVKFLIQQCNLDGYAIDFEYPYSGTEWKFYNKFLIDIKQAITKDKLLCVATAGWANKFSKEAIASIDRVEVMTYDLMDQYGYHAPFYQTAVGQIEKLLSVGFSKSQLDYGLPFYSRPLDGSAFWGTYSGDADKLGKFEFLETTPIVNHEGNPLTSPRYYNSVAMIADKTAYALDTGLGGLMIWHMTCDTSYSNELSLTKSITDTIASKKMA